MEIVIELPRDIDKLCRTCMNIVEDEENCVLSSSNDQETELNKMLFYLTGATISPNECLPKYMCNDCVKKLEISYIFKQLCQSTYLNFKNFMDSSENDIKSEKCEFSCSMCGLFFSSNYILSRHQIDHYKGNRLFKIFISDEDNELKNIIDDGEEDMISSLITERKQWIDDTNEQNDTKEKIVEEVLLENEDLMDETKLKNCDLCDRKFDSLMSLQLHFINHAILAESDTDPGIFQQFFQCYNCGETFSNQDDMDNHCKERCPTDLKVKCKMCSETFESDLLLLKHEKEYAHSDYCLWEDYTKLSEKEQYICAICKESFTAKNELYLHSVRHIIKKITCRICKKSFSCQMAHNNHLKSHPKYKHMCNLCGKWLGSRHALKTHIMGVHSVSKNFVCSVCSKAFKTPSRLYIHKLTHKEDKKFVCSVCDYKTNYVGDFRVHNRIHTAERPYKCNFVNCKRQFKTSSHLNEHIQRHLQIKKYQCNMCYMVFGHNHTLKMHLMVHTGEKPFTCQFCEVKFRRKHHLKNHMKQHANVDTENTEKNQP